MTRPGGSEEETLERLVEEARAKSAREPIPADWRETLEAVRASHVERPWSGPRGPEPGPVRLPYKVPGFASRRLLDALRFEELDL